MTSGSDQLKPSSGSGSNGSRHLSSIASAVRIGGALLICTCLLGSLANRAAVKSRLASPAIHTKHTRVRRDIQLPTLVQSLNNFNSTSPDADTDADDGLLVKRLAMRSSSSHAPIDLVLPQFPTLHAALDESEIVAVFFGAAWCKKSAQIAKRIERILGPRLQQQQQQQSATHNKKKQRPLSLVYVSSDKSKMQFHSFVNGRHFSSVPYKSAEQKLLKKHFKASAKNEQEALKIQREHEIPYIMIFSGKTHRIVSRTGVEDLKSHGLGVMDYWTDLVRGKKVASTTS